MICKILVVVCKFTSLLVCLSLISIVPITVTFGCRMLRLRPECFLVVCFCIRSRAGHDCGHYPTIMPDLFFMVRAALGALVFTVGAVTAPPRHSAVINAVRGFAAGIRLQR